MWLGPGWSAPTSTKMTGPLPALVDFRISPRNSPRPTFQRAEPVCRRQGAACTIDADPVSSGGTGPAGESPDIAWRTEKGTDRIEKLHLSQPRDGHSVSAQSETVSCVGAAGPSSNAVPQGIEWAGTTLGPHHAVLLL